MPVFFGGALIICMAFGRQHYRHGLYGGLIVALLGIVSAIVRIYQYEQFQSISDPKTQIIIAMAAICALQLSISWREVQRDRARLQRSMTSTRPQRLNCEPTSTSSSLNLSEKSLPAFVHLSFAPKSKQRSPPRCLRMHGGKHAGLVRKLVGLARIAFECRKSQCCPSEFCRLYRAARHDRG